MLSHIRIWLTKKAVLQKFKIVPVCRTWSNNDRKIKWKFTSLNHQICLAYSWNLIFIPLFLSQKSRQPRVILVIFAFQETTIRVAWIHIETHIKKVKFTLYSRKCKIFETKKMSMWFAFQSQPYIQYLANGLKFSA